MKLNKIIKKIVSSRSNFLSFFLLLAISLSIITVSFAATPDPGHDYNEIGGGLILGDLLYGSAPDTASVLAGNSSTTRMFLRQVGNGTISSAPVWDTLTKNDVGLNNVENTALSTTLANWTGSTNLTTLGTIGTGTWNATVIADNKISSTLTGKTYNGLSLTPQATGFTISGGTASRTLTITGNATISGNPISNPMTTLGDVVYGTTGGIGTRLAGATGFLNSTGASAPSWGSVDLASSDVTGTLPVANGGTGLNSITLGSLITGNGTSAIGLIAPGTSGNILVSNGTTWETSLGGIFIDTILLASGTSYTPTTGTNKIMIELWGAGGAGGGVDGGATGAIAGGGGSGGYARYYMTGVGSGPYTYSIGAGGAGVVGAAGNAGGNTTFNTGTVTITAYGGQGGGSVPGGPAVKFAFGGAGGVISTGGDYNSGGAPGGRGMTGTIRPAIFSGYGGSTSLGGGGTGIYNLTAAGVWAATSTGSGGGGANGLDPPASAGGDGADGVIIISEYR